MSTFEREAEISVWLKRHPAKLAAVAKATGIDRAKLKSAAQGEMQLSPSELARLRDHLAKIVSMDDIDSI